MAEVPQLAIVRSRGLVRCPSSRRAKCDDLCSELFPRFFNNECALNFKSLGNLITLLNYRPGRDRRPTCCQVCGINAVHVGLSK